MNFLAHIYLSGDEPDVIFGNFIGDFVRGSQFKSYSEPIQKGIKLHRFIDEYTDRHPIVKQQVKELRIYFRKYAGVALDVYLDYFLASNWEDHHHQNLRDFSSSFYKLSDQREALLPDKGKRFHHFMLANDVLFQYQTKKGISNVFQGMARRSKFDSGMENALGVLNDHEEELKQTFDKFFPDLVEASKTFRIAQLNLSA